MSARLRRHLARARPRLRELLVPRQRPAVHPHAAAAERLADAVAVEPDPQELFGIVAEVAAAELKVPAVSVVQYVSGRSGTIVGSWQEPGRPVIVAGTSVALDSTTVAGQVRAASRPIPGGAPIRIGNKPWGVLVGEGADTARVAALAETVRGVIAYADASTRLSALATRDGLTNLPDHASFHEHLRAEVRRAQRHDRTLSLVLMNLDGFRRLNEEQGRLAGDRVLTESAQRLSAAVRRGEIVSRIGGDDFAWILPETGGLDGWIAAERARRAISASPFEGVGVVTTSAGVADLQKGTSAEELFALAEIALAHAKSSGGDATFRHSDGLAEITAELRERGGALNRLRSLARRADAEVPGAEDHSERVARLAEKLAVAAGWSAEEAVRLGQAGALHDLGKLLIDGELLRKPGPLDEDELQQIRSHPTSGAEIAVDALDAEQQAWVRHHHERWDGLGYPGRLSGELIPEGARLLGLAEAWDAMTSSTPFGEALSISEALAECRCESGFQFAPDAVVALERLWRLGALDTGDARAAVAD